MAAIAATLNSEGIKASRGGTWDAGSVRSILLNPIYVGRRITSKRHYTRDPEGKTSFRIRPPEE